MNKLFIKTFMILQDEKYSLIVIDILSLIAYCVCIFFTVMVNGPLDMVTIIILAAVYVAIMTIFDVIYTIIRKKAKDNVRIKR